MQISSDWIVTEQWIKSPKWQTLRIQYKKKIATFTWNKTKERKKNIIKSDFAGDKVVLCTFPLQNFKIKKNKNKQTKQKMREKNKSSPNEREKNKKIFASN